MVEPHGCGGAATRPHAALRTSEQPGPSRMDAAPVAQPLKQRHRVRARPQKNGRQLRTSRQQQAPARSTSRSHPALKVGGRTPPTVWWFAARTEAAGSRRRMQSLCVPDGSHMNRNGHRRTSHRAARTMRARMSNAGPTRVEPHGCGDAVTRPQAAPRTSEQPGPSRMDAAPVRNPRKCQRLRTPPRQKQAPAPLAPLPPNVICERPQRAPSRAR